MHQLVRGADRTASSEQPGHTPGGHDALLEADYTGVAARRSDYTEIGMAPYDVGAVIRRARKDAGLTQDELAERAGTSQPALARYETGVVLPTLPTLERLLLGCGLRLQLDTVRAGEPSAPGTSVRGQLGPRARALRHHRRQLLDAARARGVGRVRVFGSLARGEALPASDVDLLVDLEPGRTLLDLAAFRREAHEILGMPVDVATPDMLKDRIRAEVLAEVLPL